MLADTNERPGVEENFQTACNTSDLTVEADRRGAGDVLIAAGWSDSRLGMALLRLHGEWDAAAKPRRLTERQIQLLAETIKREDEAARGNRERENGELARLDARLARSDLTAEDRFDTLVAKMEQQRLYDTGVLPKPAYRAPVSPALARARTQALLWYASDMRLLAQSLKTRAAVLVQVEAWAVSKAIPTELAGPALFHWLHSTCPVCDGHGFRKVPDQPALSGKRCHACGGSGKIPRPDGAARIQNHLDYCVQVARNSLKKRLARS